jgi:hypothetical protein
MIVPIVEHSGFSRFPIFTPELRIFGAAEVCPTTKMPTILNATPENSDANPENLSALRFS